MSQGVENALLTDLCSICHINQPKYKCPRCEIRTCSLPCIKRHKLLSECSGQRDPAAYRKRKDLATPESFDQDFNFIASVERSLERAGRDALSRGVVLDADGFAAQKPVRGEHRLKVELERSGVQVRKAPVGMTRNKQNRTYWQQRSKHISWTVEWLLDGDREVLANCVETMTVIQAFTNAVPKKLQQSHKRKHEESELAIPAVPADTQIPVHNHEREKSRSPDTTSTGDSGSSNNYHFYLHRPDLPGPQRHIIELAPTTTMRDALRGRVVIEFPTIYVLHEAPERLPETFLSTMDHDGGADQLDLKLADNEAAAASSQLSIPDHRLSSEHQGPDTEDRDFGA